MSGVSNDMEFSIQIHQMGIINDNIVYNINDGLVMDLFIKDRSITQSTYIHRLNPNRPVKYVDLQGYYFETAIIREFIHVPTNDPNIFELKEIGEEPIYPAYITRYSSRRAKWTRSLDYPIVRPPSKRYIPNFGVSKEWDEARQRQMQR